MSFFRLLSRVSKPGCRLLSAQSKVYEIRTYDIVPKDYGRFLALSKEKLHLRLEVSKCLGYWLVDMGGLNQVVHIWEYDSFAHRAAVRKQLGGDAKWQSEYFQPVLPMFAKQTNAMMYAFDWQAVQDPKTSPGQAGMFDLEMYSFDEMNQTTSSKMKAFTQETSQAGVAPIGVWFTDVGQAHQVYRLLRYHDGDHRREVQAIRREKYGEGLGEHLRQSKLIVPAPWSPMQ